MAEESGLVLTHPDADWSLRMDLPGFSLGAPKLFRDRTQVWIEAHDDESAVMLTAFIEKVPEARDSDSCRKYYVKKLKGHSARPSMSERGEMALTELLVADLKHLHAYMHREGFCVDLHLSKAPFRDDQAGLFNSVLESVSIGPATEQERARAAMYPVSGGPGEALVLEVAQKLRANDFTAAEALVSPLCPWQDGRPPQGARQNSPECGLRTALVAEARRLATAKDLALMYWRVAEMVQKDGKLGAAEAIYRKSIDLNPGDPGTWYSLGHLYRDSKDLDAAASAFKRALELDSRDADTLYWVATNLMDQGYLDEAMSMLDRVLEVDPKFVRVWYRKGQIQMLRGEYQGALDNFEKAKSLGVDARMTRQRIRECREALGRH